MYLASIIFWKKKLFQIFLNLDQWHNHKATEAKGVNYCGHGLYIKEPNYQRKKGGSSFAYLYSSVIIANVGLYCIPLVMLLFLFVLILFTRKGLVQPPAYLVWLRKQVYYKAWILHTNADNSDLYLPGHVITYCPQLGLALVLLNGICSNRHHFSSHFIYLKKDTVTCGAYPGHFLKFVRGSIIEFLPLMSNKYL